MMEASSTYQTVDALIVVTTQNSIFQAQVLIMLS